MNRQFLEASIWKGKYLRSPYATASYYAECLARNFEICEKADREKAMAEDVKGYVSGGARHLLPYRIGILQKDACREINHSGRGCKPIFCQLKGAYTKNEISPYKQFKPYAVQTGIWRVEGERTLYYGTIGITGPNGRTDKDMDLVLIHTEDFREVEVFVFVGLAGNPENLKSAVDYVKCLRSK